MCTEREREPHEQQSHGNEKWFILIFWFAATSVQSQYVEGGGGENAGINAAAGLQFILSSPWSQVCYTFPAFLAEHFPDKREKGAYPGLPALQCCAESKPLHPPREQERGNCFPDTPPAGQIRMHKTTFYLKACLTISFL